MASNEKKSSGGDHPVWDEFVRRFKTNPLLFSGTVIVLVIVIVAFVFVPAIVPSAGGGMVDLTFGSYNKVPITYAPGSYFAQVHDNLAREYQQYGNEIYSQYQLLIWWEAFNAAVVHTGILDEMKQAGYTVPEETVNRQIAERPDLLSLYRQSDNTAKIALWRQIQEDILNENYRIDMGGFHIPPSEAAFIGAMTRRERSFSLASLPLSAYPDEEAVNYAAEHQDLFRVTKLSKITLRSSEKEAQQVLGTIRGEIVSFEDAARTHSQDLYADRGGEMESKMAYELAAEIQDEAEREKVIGLGKGEISQVIKVPDGWAFFRAEETVVPADTADRAALDNIRRYLRTFERGRMEDWLVKDAETLSALIREEGFDEALALRGLEKRDFGPLPLNFGDTSLFTRLSSFGIPELANAEGSERFWQTAFSTPLTTPSAPLVWGDAVVILYPREETEAESDVSKVEEGYSSSLLEEIINRNIRSYFTTNGKMEDRFEKTYNQYFLPAN